MAPEQPEQQHSHEDVLVNINNALQNLQNDYKYLLEVVKTIEERNNTTSQIPLPCHGSGDHNAISNRNSPNLVLLAANGDAALDDSILAAATPAKNAAPAHAHDVGDAVSVPQSPRSAVPGSTSRIILTTYPGQAGIDPIAMNWGNESPTERGPVVVSRSQSTLRRRNGKFPPHNGLKFLL